MRYARRGGVIIGVIVLVWLLIGMIAAWQRDYFKGGNTSCASAATIALTVITGPLNYAGVNPKATHSNTVMILVKGQKPLTLAAPARLYYNNLMYQLWRDSKHVHYIQDFWSDRTGPGGQSADATTAYIVLSLAGQQGEPLANESLEAVRHVVDVTVPPARVKAHVIGPCHTGSGQEQPPITSSRQVQPPAIELKHVRYEVFGPAGATANLNYKGVNGQPNRVDNVQLPWLIEFEYLTTLPSVDVNIVAQTDADQIGCRILVDGVVRAESVKRGIPGAKTETDCTVKVENGRSLPK